MAYDQEQYHAWESFKAWITDTLPRYVPDTGEDDTAALAEDAISLIDHAVSFSADIRLGAADDEEGWAEFDRLDRQATELAGIVRERLLAVDPDAPPVP